MDKIIVIGAGFGGLRVALLLAKDLRARGFDKKYEVVLVDRNEHHTYTPLLYEVAAASKTAANLTDLHDLVAHRIASIVAGKPITFLQAEIRSINTPDGCVELADGRKIQGKFVVLAPGSETNYFSIPGLKEYSLPMKTFVDAVRIRDTIATRAEEKKVLRIIVGGGGSTGVELAGELVRSAPPTARTVTILEATPTLLPGFPEKVVRLVAERLAKLGVKIITGNAITNVAPGSITLGNGATLPFDICIWAGGVAAPQMLKESGVETESRGRLMVSNGMACIPRTPELKIGMKVYALGDCICVIDPVTKNPAPGVARAALLQADVVAANIFEEIRNAEEPAHAARPMTYAPAAYPYITPVGGKYAVAKIGPFIFSGFLAWLLKGLIELNYLRSIMPIGHAARIWLKGLLVFIKNDLG